MSKKNQYLLEMAVKYEERAIQQAQKFCGASETGYSKEFAQVANWFAIARGLREVAGRV